MVCKLFIFNDIWVLYFFVQQMGKCCSVKMDKMEDMLDLKVEKIIKIWYLMILCLTLDSE